MSTRPFRAQTAIRTATRPKQVVVLAVGVIALLLGVMHAVALLLGRYPTLIELALLGVIYHQRRQ